MSKNRRTYDAEFKRDAVRLVEDSGLSASEVAESLGVGVDLIYRWRRGMRRQEHVAFPGQGKQALTDDQRRIRELKKKLKDAELDRDILKKHWPSSARHRNEIASHQEPPLTVFGEEDVPRSQRFQERILCVE